MPTYFANPYGLLGLLAVPAILIIHMLREKSRRVRVSTLFLLEAMPPRTPRGRALHWIQNSWPLWLQLLAAILCAWLLADPRWVRTNSFQSVAVILDSTASMSAARERVLAKLPGLLRDRARMAHETEWVIGTSDAPGIALYRGRELRDAVAALARWQPLQPRLDPAPAFANALANARGQGTIFFVSDEEPEALPAGVTLLAFGRPVENVGFAGVRTWRDADGAHWEAIVKNSGATPQDRAWHFEATTVRSRPQGLHLAPGQLETIGGPFPTKENHLRVLLSSDEFTLDDELPLVAPEPKALKIFVSTPPELAVLFEKVLKTVPAVERPKLANEADVVIASSETKGQPAIVLGGKGDITRPPTGSITADTDPLMDGLVWDGLLSLGPNAITTMPKDQTLLWQGDQPLIFLRTSGNARQLFLNFDLTASNAARLPAFVLLVSRYLSAVREAKNAHFAENFETGQTLPVNALGASLVFEGGAPTQPLPGGFLRAPLQAGFFSVRVLGQEMIDAAAHFGDPREADFRQAKTNTLEDSRATALRQLNSMPDPLASVWLAVVAAALLASWAVQGRAFPTA